MPNLFISYDLHEASEDRYTAVQSAIGQLGTAIHLQWSVYYVKSQYTIAQCRDHVAKQMLSQDTLLVIEANSAISQNIDSNSWQRAVDLWNP